MYHGERNMKFPKFTLMILLFCVFLLGSLNQATAASQTPIRMYVDTPTFGSTIKGTTIISGWSLNKAGIAKVELYTGTTLLGTTTSKNYLSFR